MKGVPRQWAVVGVEQVTLTMCETVGQSGLRWYQQSNIRVLVGKSPPMSSCRTPCSGTRDVGARFFNGGGAGTAGAVYCPELRLSSRLCRESVLRRDSTLLRPSGVRGGIEGLGVSAGGGKDIGSS